MFNAFPLNISAKEGEKEYSDIEVFFEVNDRRCEGKNTYVLLSAKINEELEPNYYELKVKTNKGQYSTVIAVAPNQCYSIDKKGKDRLFGFSLQLYSLKSRRNWGIGDFTDLSNFVEICARSGGDVIGLNPLNVLCHDYPESASPYNSVSRLFLNPIYIDVEKVPYYDEKDKDVNAISKAKSEEKINYTLVYNAKIKALKNIYERAKKDKGGEYFIEFEKFKKENGVELQRLALFQGISHEKFLLNEKVTKEWQKAYESALGSGVEKFEKDALLEKIAEGLGVTIDDLASEDDKFVIKATEQYGSRGKVDAQQLIENANALFAGGDITEEDKTYVMEALQEAYWRAKIKNKRHIPKKYRKDNSDNTEKNSEN